MVIEAIIYKLGILIPVLYTMMRIILIRDRLFIEISSWLKFLIEKNQSIMNKIENFKRQLFSVEGIKIIIILLTPFLMLFYVAKADPYGNCWLSRPECTSTLNMDYLVVAYVFLFYFVALIYIFSGENERKKMDTNFIPYPIKVDEQMKKK